LIDARHYFLFSFYCRGINNIDIGHLKWKDEQNGRLVYTRKKTGELFNLELMEPAKTILEHYRHLTYKNDSSYIFPILNEGHIKPVTIYNRLTKMLRKFNADLKEIGVLAGVNANLTSYVARHSYATVMKQMGVSTTVISQAMGHSSEKVTAVYLDSFANELVDEASKAIL
jgi:integrase